jgi:hypothetical protein
VKNVPIRKGPIRRASRVLAILLGGVVCSLAAALADAQPYPAHPIRLIVPFAPGGTVDVIARLIGVRMTEITGQAVVVDNRGGAGGVLGTELVARAPGDGYTLLLHSAAIAYEPALRAKLPYDARRIWSDQQGRTTPNLLVINPPSGAFRARLVALAKRSRRHHFRHRRHRQPVISQSNCSATSGTTFNHVPERRARADRR